VKATCLPNCSRFERDECALVSIAHSQNLPIEHRADVSPIALLGVELVTARHAVRAGSSPEHAYNIAQPRAPR
jgi:hypothetical protein